MKARRSHRAKMGKGYQELRDRVRFWMSKMKVQPRRVQVQSMANKWASCSTGGTVSFNIQLIGKTAYFKDTVIVHELLHLSVPNHGKLFKSLSKIYLSQRN